MRISFVRDQLLAHFHRGQARIQAGGAARRVGLTLAIDDGGEIGQQGWEMDFRTLPPPDRKRIEAGEATGHLMGAFANGDPAPPEFALRAALPTGPEFLHGPSHQAPTATALEGLDRVDQQRLDRICEFHSSPSSVESPGV